MTDKNNVSTEDMAQTMKKRAAKSMEHEDEGTILVVNEGMEKTNFDVWYLDVDTEEMTAEQYNQEEVLTQVMQINKNKMRKMRRELGDDMYDPELGDAPSWVRGVLSDEDFDTGFKIELEYVLGNTAIARRFTEQEDGEPKREEWVLTYSDDTDAMTLTAKLEVEDRFSDEDWKTFAEGKGRMTKNLQEHEDSDLPEMEVTDIAEFGYNKREEFNQDIGAERIKEAIKGVIGKKYEDGDSFEFKVESFDESTFFRINIDDEMYYYWFESVSNLGMPFKIPDWALLIADTDGIINLEV